MSAVSYEIRKLTRLALPVVAAQLGTMLMGIVDSLMVSRLGVDALAAVSLAGAWIFASLLFGQGFVHGIDPIITQAHGARNGDAVGRALQHGIVVALAISVPLCALIFFTEDFLVAIGQSSELAAVAQSYAIVQLPSVPFFLCFLAIRQYLQGREIVRPAMWVIFVANVVNVAAGSSWCPATSTPASELLHSPRFEAAMTAWVADPSRGPTYRTRLSHGTIRPMHSGPRPPQRVANSALPKT